MEDYVIFILSWSPGPAIKTISIKPLKPRTPFNPTPVFPHPKTVLPSPTAPKGSLSHKPLTYLSASFHQRLPAASKISRSFEKLMTPMVLTGSIPSKKETGVEVRRIFLPISQICRLTGRPRTPDKSFLFIRKEAETICWILWEIFNSSRKYLQIAHLPIPKTGLIVGRKVTWTLLMTSINLPQITTQRILWFVQEQLSILPSRRKSIAISSILVGGDRKNSWIRLLSHAKAQLMKLRSIYSLQFSSGVSIWLQRDLIREITAVDKNQGKNLLLGGNKADIKSPLLEEEKVDPESPLLEE